MEEATTAGAMGRNPTSADTLALRGTASAVSALLYAGLEMDDGVGAAAATAAAADEGGC